MGEIEMMKSFESLALEIERAASGSQSYALGESAVRDFPKLERMAGGEVRDAAGRRISYSRLRQYEQERVETLRLYLHMMGVGTNPDETRARVQEKVVELLVERRESIRITELERRFAEDVPANRDVFEPVFGRAEYAAELYRDEKRRIVVQYYVSPATAESKHEEGFYVYTPSGLQVIRASQAELGSGVLGVAYIGMGLIKILDTLQGQDYKEVLKHEVLHHQYPHESEREIRQRTTNELPFPTSYQHSY
jgi:hypothetical protein